MKDGVEGDEEGRKQKRTKGEGEKGGRNGNEEEEGVRHGRKERGREKIDVEKRELQMK